MARDSFEIYYYQDGRWSVHATFEAAQREQALAEAQELEKTLRAPVRLVRETYYPETNKSEEAISWQSTKAKEMPDADTMFGQKAAAPPKPKNKPAPPPRRKEPEEAPPQAAAPPPRPKRRRKKKKPSRGVAAKLAIVVSMSLAMSVGAAVMTTLGIIGLQKMKVISEDDRRALVAGIFVTAYAVSALYQLVRQFELWKSWGFLRRRSERPTASPKDMIKKMNQAARTASDASADTLPDDNALPITDTDIDQLREQIAAEDAEDAEDAEAEDEEEAAAEESGDRLGDDDTFATEVQAEPAGVAEAAAQAPEPPPQPVAVEPPPPPPKPEPPKPEPPKVEKPVEKAPERPAAEVEAQRTFNTFVSDAVALANRAQTQLNAMSRFGLNLYLAGACSSLGQSRKLGRTPQLLLLRDGLQMAGTTRERADNFCAELPSYGKNPRYAGMIQAGGQAMARQMSGQSQPAADLTDLLNEWGRPEKRSTVPAEITFLFTDLVGSTAMTSQLGNAGAQKVVRAHNSAVRDAIKAFGGREVKHTGDGIMATFPTPLAAVQATIRMQKELVQVANSNPALNFSVRMGVNVGEAVQEENDFFGAAVQMTARICAAATERNIWVSKAIVDACKGQRIGFIPRGAFQMKGIQQARPLYEVAYTDAHRNELANL
jgi:adenylate cyclase